MSLKQINFPIKLNFFKKLFLLTIGVVFLTIIIGFSFNLIFFDKFYIYRKKNNIINVRNQIVKNMDDKEKLNYYIQFAQDSYGVKIDLTSIQNNRTHMMSSKKIYNSLKINESVFKMREMDGSSGVMFLRYYEKLPNGYLLSIRSSLAVLAEHVHDMFIFNIFTALVSLLISSILVSIFSRKVTKNITHLKTNAQKIAKLEYPENIIIKSGDEIEELSYSLNDMSQELSIAIENLKSFVSNASHELKTPISVLCLYSQALARDSVDEKNKKEYYKIMLEKSLEMRSLTESLLTLSKINSPDYKLKSEEINLETLILSSIEQYDYLEFEKNIDIKLNLSKSIIKGDYNLFKITVNNLIQNMLKYSPDNSNVEITLNDTSISFENVILYKLKGSVEDLFQPFYRDCSSANEKIEGSGLGLSLVKKILELHKLDYNLNIDNSIFKFTINLKEKTD
ncbi:MAG: HAMP domain-containing sensor histidine kinase [Cetobacterium sp.]|uniref:HAMP domain-containing sensor histidine kinase n=1 Tax=Cetobacterium sp. TaxID=2071632 RepID=UPI002FCBE3E8